VPPFTSISNPAWQLVFCSLPRCLAATLPHPASSNLNPSNHSAECFPSSSAPSTPTFYRSFLEIFLNEPPPPPLAGNWDFRRAEDIATDIGTSRRQGLAEILLQILSRFAPLFSFCFHFKIQMVDNLNKIMSRIQFDYEVSVLPSVTV
jgi:hypothetical protein